MPMPQTPIDAEAGAARNGGRRPTVVAAPASASPELSDRPRRRTFTAEAKLRILATVLRTMRQHSTVTDKVDAWSSSPRQREALGPGFRLSPG